jgi:soluble lytic murein transglycosylase-like protein
MRRAVLWMSLGAAGAWVAPPAARAELVLLHEGRVVKAAGYAVVGDELEIRLPGGGSYRIDLARVDRILDDEVEVSETEVAELPTMAGEDAGVFDLSYASGGKPLFGTRYDALIDREARRAGIDAALVSAVIRAESNYQPRSVSRKGARGLMQLMPGTARRFGVLRPFDPEANVRAGVRYLRELADRFGDRPELVLAAYNAGENAVESFGGVPPYRETVAYVKRILGWWKAGSAESAAAAAHPPNAEAEGPATRR